MSRYLRVLVWFCLAPAAALADTLDGRLLWSDERELGLPVSGIIAEVLVRAGDRAAAGVELLRLDRRPFEARRAAAQAELERIQPAFEEAQAELERAQDLLDRTVTSEADFRVAEIAARQSRAAFAAAQARLALTEWELAASSLRSPTAVRILTVDAHAGQAVANGDRVRPLLRVAEAATLDAEVQLSAAQVQPLNPGDRVNLRRGRERIPAEVVAIEYRGDASAANRYLVRVRLPVDPGVRPDLEQSVRVELP